MSLTLYKKKRSFDETPEPKAQKKSSSSGLKFVVQKHEASRLHYDFRLEMEGVLKSWAVPKGPSLNPQDKRLAMMVEDHPYDYRTFEGTIPEGNYGAGTVMVWDEGTYEAMDHAEEPVKKQEKTLLEELKKGDLKIVLHGKKLKGAFALVKMKGRGENAWLLIKKDDKEASETDITKKDRSVKTKRTMNQIAGTLNNKKKVAKKSSAGGSKTVSLTVKKKSLL
jgi:bifunctional non-homologous end joining protein LigD